MPPPARRLQWKTTIVRLPSLAGFHGPGGAATSVAGRQMREQRGAAERYGVAIVYDFVDRMLLAAGHDLRQLFCQSVRSHIAFIRGIHQDVAGGRNDQEGTQGLRAHVIHTAYDIVRR